MKGLAFSQECHSDSGTRAPVPGRRHTARLPHRAVSKQLLMHVQQHANEQNKAILERTSGPQIMIGNNSKGVQRTWGKSWMTRIALPIRSLIRGSTQAASVSIRSMPYRSGSGGQRNKGWSMMGAMNQDNAGAARPQRGANQPEARHAPCQRRPAWKSLQPVGGRIRGGPSLPRRRITISEHRAGAAGLATIIPETRGYHGC